MKNSLLYEAAQTWDRLCNFSYHLTYGFKMQLYTIDLTFSPRDFPHLAGFQYLKDVSLPRYSPVKYVERILEGKITQELIEKGAKYKEMVEPRLLALERLDEILNNEFILYSYIPMFLPFFTQLKADYLISSHIDGINFVFLIRDSRKAAVSHCVCSSAFIKDTRDFEAGQRHYTLLRKTRINLSDNSTTVLFQKKGVIGLPNVDETKKDSGTPHGV